MDPLDSDLRGPNLVHWAEGNEDRWWWATCLCLRRGGPSQGYGTTGPFAARMYPQDTHAFFFFRFVRNRRCSGLPGTGQLSVVTGPLRAFSGQTSLVGCRFSPAPKNRSPGASSSCEGTVCAGHSTQERVVGGEGMRQQFGTAALQLPPPPPVVATVLSKLQRA